MRRLAPLIAGCVLVSSCYVATHYDGWRYRGGPFANHGLFARPRYEARFAAIPFNVPGSYEYSFRRFPADDAYVMLATPSGPPPASIERLTTMVQLRVVDANGQLRCAASGFPAGKGEAQLVVNSSAVVLGLYHLRCGLIELRACDPCHLHVGISQVDMATPAIVLVPTLRGGGYELP